MTLARSSSEAEVWGSLGEGSLGPHLVSRGWTWVPARKQKLSYSRTNNNVGMATCKVNDRVQISLASDNAPKMVTPVCSPKVACIATKGFG